MLNDDHNPGFTLTRIPGREPVTTIPEKELEYRKRESKLEKAAVRDGGLTIGYNNFDELSPIILKRIDEHFRNYIQYDADGKSLTFQGMSRDMIHALMKDIKDPDFYNLLQKVYGEMEALLSKNEAEVARDRQSELDWIQWGKEQIALVNNELNQSKAIPPKPEKREYSDDEQSRFLDYHQEKSLEDLEDRKQIILTEENRINKKVKNLKSQIEAARNACEPYNHKVSELEERLKKDVDEGEFRELKISLEFNESKILRLNTEIETLESEQAELEEKLTSFELEKNIIDLSLEKIRLNKDFGVNWAKRKKSVVIRVERLLADRAGLYARREHLNAEWARITGDSNELIKPLNYAGRFVSAF